MGIPQSYSRALPERCIRLIDRLLPEAERVRMPGEEHLGPLTTTFLLAIATPMILLPVERVERHRGVGDQNTGYMDERSFDPSLTHAVDQALGGQKLDHSPFFVPGHWRFAAIKWTGQNVAEHFPHELQQRLRDPSAEAAAANMPASQWASCLRNALAHGGVIYLDDQGRQSFGGTASPLAFVSAKYPNGPKSQPPEELRVLRISEPDFLAFLHEWARWVSVSGLSQMLAA